MTQATYERKCLIWAYSCRGSVPLVAELKLGSRNSLGLTWWSQGPGRETPTLGLAWVEISMPTHSDTPYPNKATLNPSQTVPPAGNQVFTQMSLRGGHRHLNHHSPCKAPPASAFPEPGEVGSHPGLRPQGQWWISPASVRASQVGKSTQLVLTVFP